MLKHWKHVRPFVTQLQRDGICPAHASTLAAALDGSGNDIGEFSLQLQFAAVKDIGSKLIKATYALEGERLELLVVYRRVTELRALGQALKELLEKIEAVLNGDASVSPASINRALLPSVRKLVRDNMTPARGLRVAKRFGPHRFFGEVADDGDIVPNPHKPEETTKLFLVRYDDNDTETMYTAEVEEHYAEFTDDRYVASLRGLIPAFDYLESRLTGGEGTSDRHSCEGSLLIARYGYMLPATLCAVSHWGTSC